MMIRRTLFVDGVIGYGIRGTMISQSDTYRVLRNHDAKPPRRKALGDWTIGLALVGALFAWSKGPAQEPSPPPPPMEGLWPSDKLMSQLLLRWADDVCVQFDLDESQREKASSGLVKRWSPFLNEKRGQLQPLLNEFVEMRMDLKPPSADQVKAWAQRALPVFQECREQMNQGTTEFREILHSGQRIKFEIEAAKFNAGMVYAEHKLMRWREGDFEEKELWEPTPAERRKRRAEKERKDHADRAAAARTEKDPIAVELDSWEEFTKQFILKFALDEPQRLAALSCLEELRGRALEHRDRHRSEIARLESRIQRHAGSETELNDIKIELSKLYGPVDEMFQELKRRLEAIPSDAQREKAGITKDSAAPDSANK